MKIQNASNTPPNILDALLRAIPFYKSVRLRDQDQFQRLMDHSNIVQFTSGEQVLARGDDDLCVYFVVKGQLTVSLPDSDGNACRVNYITPGEIFGDLSVLLTSPRTADVFVDAGCREAILFKTDFTLFGELEDFSQLSLLTKLDYYRHNNHSLRWKLEMYRSKYRDHSMANKHREIKLYTQSKDDLGELKALHKQAKALAELFTFWNQSFGKLSFDKGMPIPEQSELTVK